MPSPYFSMYDCFTLFNELELLDIRLYELAPVVRGFIIVEARQTFTGKPKSLTFDPDKYKDYNIDYRAVDLPFTENVTEDQARTNEVYQRNSLAKALERHKFDVAIVSDLDEIPSRETVTGITRQQLPIKIQLDQCFYSFKMGGEPLFSPYGPVMMEAREVLQRTPQACRSILYVDGPSVKGGWHCNFFGDKKAKMDAFLCHKEEYSRAFNDEITVWPYKGPLPHLIGDKNGN